MARCLSGELLTAQMQEVGPLKMEAGAGSLKDYKNMGQAWTCGVK